MAETYGEGKPDAKDAFTIADASRSQPRNIEPVAGGDDTLAEAGVASAARDDAVRERARLYNRLHDLICQTRPALDVVFAKQKPHNELGLVLVARHGGPGGFRRSGRARASKWAGGLKRHRNAGPPKASEILDAIARQTVAMPAPEAMGRQARKIAERTLELEAEEDALNEELERLSSTLPEAAMLRSVPGVGRVYGAAIAAEIGDIGKSPSASHLASCGGIAPAREESGTSVRKSSKRRGGDRRPKNAFIQSAQAAATHDERARAYYDKKRAEGKGRKQALRALARRRVDAIYALLANGEFHKSSVAAE